MDAGAMKPASITLLPQWHLPLWATVPLAAAHLAVGIGLGMLYFGSVWWNARQFAAGARVLPTIASMIGRFVLLGGVLIARPVVMRHVKRVA
jgi:hypothetical protein